MKKSLLLLLAVMFVALSGHARKRILSPLEKATGMEIIFTDPSTPEGAATLQGIDKDAITNLKGVEMLIAQDEEKNDKLSEAFSSFIKKKECSLLAEVVEPEFATVRVYSLQPAVKDSAFIHGAIFEVIFMDNLIIMAVDGDIDTSKLDNIVQIKIDRTN